MRTKAIPPAPDDLDELVAVQAAIPLVPEPHESCCVRLAQRVEGIDKDSARTWIAFMAALGLVESGELGYVRTDRDVSASTLRDPFCERVFGVDAVLAALETADSLDADGAFDAIRDDVPQWERHRNPQTWEQSWRERVGDLLAWAALFGLVRRDGSRYRLAD